MTDRILNPSLSARELISLAQTVTATRIDLILHGGRGVLQCPDRHPGQAR